MSRFALLDLDLDDEPVKSAPVDKKTKKAAKVEPIAAKPTTTPATTKTTTAPAVTQASKPAGNVTIQLFLVNSINYLIRQYF